MFINQNCHYQTFALEDTKILQYLREIQNWEYDPDTRSLSASFKFTQYLHGPKFAVLIGTMADQQDHHPEIHIGFKKCSIVYSTHSAKGVTTNDFICAAKSNIIYEQFL